MAARRIARADVARHDAEQYAWPRKQDVQTENKALQSAHRRRSTWTTPATDFLITARIDQVADADAGAPLLRPERSDFPEITLPVTHHREL